MSTPFIKTFVDVMVENTCDALRAINVIAADAGIAPMSDAEVDDQVAEMQNDLKDGLLRSLKNSRVPYDEVDNGCTCLSCQVSRGH